MGSTLGWSREAAMLDSRMNRSRNRSSSASSGATSLRATFRWGKACSARYTTLIPPRPSTERMRKPASSVPIRGSCAIAPPGSGPRTPPGADASGQLDLHAFVPQDQAVAVRTPQLLGPHQHALQLGVGVQRVVVEHDQPFYLRD